MHVFRQTSKTSGVLATLFLLLFLSSVASAQVQSTLQATLFYEDKDASFRAFNQPVVDKNGNVIVFGTQFGFGCGFNVCGVVVYSIAPNGTLNWRKPDTGFAANAVNQVALGLDNTIYFQDFFSSSRVFAYDPNGNPVLNWPVIADFPLDTGSRNLVVDPLDGSILVKSGTNFSFSTFPGQIKAYHPDGSEKWRADFPQMANNTPGMVIGPNDDIYTTADQGLILRGADGTFVCGFGPFAPLAGGSGGVFTQLGTSILKMNPDCSFTTVFTSSRGQVSVFDYDGGIVFAGEPNALIGVRPDGTIWRNTDLAPIQLPIIKNGFLYFIGFDSVDQKRKLFVIDENSGVTNSNLDLTGICESCAVAAASSGDIYIANVASTQIFHSNGPASGPPAPLGLTAIVGNGSAYLRWHRASGPIDSYVVTILQPDGTSISQKFSPPLVATLAGSDQSTSTLIAGLHNNERYAFSVAAAKNGTVGPASPFVRATVTGANGGNIPPHPSEPIVLIHGWNGSGGIFGTFEDTIDFFANTLNWHFGGELYHINDSEDNHVDLLGMWPDLVALPAPSVDAKGDFFTLAFGSPIAEYPDHSGLSHEGDEMKVFINKLLDDGVRSPLVLVGHSDGGLAARDYLTRSDSDTTHISSLITYGTPHRGADVDFPRLVGFLEGDGARDSAFILPCTTDINYLTSYLADLNNTSRHFPLQLHYATLVGTSTIFPRDELRTPDCHSAVWDGLVPLSSADLRKANNFPTTADIKFFHTDRNHLEEANDFSTILCATNPGCIQIIALSPVELDVQAPSGHHMRPELAEIVGASYQSIQDTPTHTTTAVTIPFPLGGDYKVVPIPKAGTGPNDTFTIKIEQNGQTQVLAQDVRIQDIPPDGYHQTVNAFPIAIAGADQTIECSAPGGANVMLNGAASHDPDDDLLSFQWTDEQGNIVGTAPLSNVFVPLGTHLFKLTLQDGRGGFGVSYVTIVVQDTTVPSVAVSLSPTILWPPNHKFVPVTATVTANDTCDTNAQVRLVSITSSETDPRGFVLGADFGTADMNFQLRAERLNETVGRTYTITYSATDSSGNSALKTAQVVVPRDDDYKP